MKYEFIIERKAQQHVYYACIFNKHLEKQLHEPFFICDWKEKQKNGALDKSINMQIISG